MTTHLTETELAERWKISVSSIQKWRTGKVSGPAYIALGVNTVRYRLEDIEAYENARVQGGYLPPQAKKILLRCATVFDTMRDWKMTDAARVIMTSAAAEARRVAMNEKPIKESV